MCHGDRDVREYSCQMQLKRSFNKCYWTYIVHVFLKQVIKNIQI